MHEKKKVPAGEEDTWEPEGASSSAIRLGDKNAGASAKKLICPDGKASNAQKEKGNAFLRKQSRVLFFAYNG